MPGVERRTTRGPAPRNRLLVPLVAVAGVALIAIGLVASLSGGGGGGGGGTTGASQASTLGKGMVGSSATPHAGATSPSAPAATPALTDACTSGKKLTPGGASKWITVQGVARGYLLAIPDAVRTSRALPVIVNFHGFNETAIAQENYTHLSLAGTKAGYVVITPLGAKNRWNFVRRAAVGPDDVAFITTALDTVASQTCIDKTRVFLAGMSDGADMAVALACAQPDRFAAVVPVAASVLPATCGKSPPSMLEIHGTADPVVPYAGGGGDRPPPFQGTEAQPAERRLRGYAADMGCGSGPVTRSSAVDTRLLTWTGCPGNKDVGLLAVDGGGHTWPGATPRPNLGKTTTSFNANTVILAFFKGHPRTAAAAPAPAATANPDTAGSLAGLMAAAG